MAAPAAKLDHIPDILEEHFEEVQFLWGIRGHAIRSPRYTLREIADLEERIEAHVAALLGYGNKVLPLVDQSFDLDDSLAAFAGAYTLLRMQSTEHASRVIDALTDAPPKRLNGLSQALCHAPIDALLPRLRQLFASGTPANAATAGEVLAFHGVQLMPAERILDPLADENPAVRTSAWRILQNTRLNLDPKNYAAAMRDEDPGVRDAAIDAATWNRTPGVLILARQACEKADPADIKLFQLLSIIGIQEDLPRIAALCNAEKLGPQRFALAGSFGNPRLMNVVLDALSNPDPAVAASAAAAFMKMTGLDIATDTRAQIQPDPAKPADDFEKEFQEEVLLPDAKKARAHWEKVGNSFAHARRLCRGVDASNGIDASQYSLLDMESRWELGLRSSFAGTWEGMVKDLERFPVPR